MRKRSNSEKKTREEKKNSHGPLHKVYSFKEWIWKDNKGRTPKNNSYSKSNSDDNVQFQMSKYGIESVTRDALKTEEYKEVHYSPFPNHSKKVLKEVKKSKEEERLSHQVIKKGKRIPFSSSDKKETFKILKEIFGDKHSDQELMEMVDNKEGVVEATLDGLLNSKALIQRRIDSKSISRATNWQVQWGPVASQP